MKKKATQIPPRAQLALAIAAPLVVLLAGWFLLVGPQRAKATGLNDQALDLQAQIATAEAALRTAPKEAPIRVADVLRLTRAMPDREDMPGIILQLNAAARQAGIGFTSIAPGTATAATGYGVRQIQLSFSGSYYGLSDFLYRLRNLVGVHGGELSASGRLFSVEQIDFNEGDKGFPQITAQLVVDAYVYGTALTPAPVAAPAPTTTDGTTTTTTETTTTSTGAVASAAPSTGVSG